MKKVLLMVLASLPLSMPLAWADDAHHPAPDNPPATAMPDKDKQMQMGKMQENMLRMHEQMHKIMQSKDVKEREKLMQEHMKMMQDNMHRMQGGMMCGGMMGPGKMDGGMKGQ